MKNTKNIILKRISYMDKIILDEIIERFKAYGVSFYNNCGEFDYQNLREQCIEIAVILHKNDESINGIRYQLCDFMSIVQKLVGIRNIGSFMYNG